MTPRELLALTVAPVLAWMGEPYESPEAAVMLLAIAGQESDCTWRRQLGGGPACSLWQIEPAGVEAVLSHRTVGPEAARLLREYGLEDGISAANVHRVIELSDRLACAFARLLLYADPHPLPRLGRPADAWDCYLRCWRPGKPRPADWPVNYHAALAAVRGEELTA